MLEFKKYLLSFLISASPLGEMKIGMLLAIFRYGIGPWEALFFCVSGNLLVFPLLDWLMKKFGPVVFRDRGIKEKAAKFRSNTRKRTKGLIDKYGFWGLMVFVMIPLPGTGAYLGTIAAYAFNIERQKAFIAISFGVILCGIIYEALIYLGIVTEASM